MAFTPGSKHGQMADINMTPLIDMMLVLLIIFLITVPVVTQSIALNLPKQTNVPRVTKPENIELVKRAMVGVNKEGTGARAFAGAEYTSGGKTGTAQVIAIKAGEKYNEAATAERHRDHALFIAFAPLEAPKIALAVLVENAGFGATAAAPIARMVLDYYLLGKKPRKAVEDDAQATQGD